MVELRQDGKEGVTLLEAMMAVMLISIGMAGACAVIVSAQKLSDFARSHYVAINICKNRLERARELEYSALNTLAESGTRVNTIGSSDPSGNFRRSTVVSNVTAALKEIIVTTEIKNRVTLTFTGEQETLRSLFTEY